MLAEHIWRAYYRLQFYLDAPGLYRQLQFRDLRKVFYRDLWRIAAANTGANLSEWEFGFYRIERGGMTTAVNLSSVMLDDHLTLDIMGNKALTHSLLSELGCPVPDICGYSMRDLAKAEKFLKKLDAPLVVKPTSGTGGGRGVTTNITSVSDLKKASRLASRFDTDLLAEEHIDGASYRLLYLDGVFIDAVRRDPPVLTGDGRHTIRQLIKHENKRRLDERPIAALSPLKLDMDCVKKLAAQGLAPGSKLADGRTVEIKHAVNENRAAQNHGVKHLVHPDTIALGARLVQNLNVHFAGLDLICRDITAPLTNSNGRVNEINTTPGIHHHYLVSNPDAAVPVAELVLEHLFADRHGVMFLAGRSGRKPAGAAREKLASVT